MTESIGRYELKSYLGGGMARVYRGYDPAIGREVAIKVLTEEGCLDPDQRARLRMEGQILRQISHENVVKVFDFGEDERGRPFLVMELLQGEDLRHAIRNGHTGDLRGKVKIAIQIARAVEAVHQVGVIDRDLKPENVFLCERGVVKLLDFGIAKVAGSVTTQAGYVLGTPSYMAPEQIQGDGITHLVDVWSFGAVLFELLTGAKAIPGKSIPEILYNTLFVPLDGEPMHRAGVPQSICDLVTRCLSKDPAGRPQGFGQIRAELERIIADAADNKIG